MGILHRILHPPPTDAAEARDAVFRVDVEASLLSDRRSFQLTCCHPHRAPLRMRNLTYQPRFFTLHVHEKALQIADVHLEARGEPVQDANFIAAFLGGRPARSERGHVVDFTLQLKASAIEALLTALPRITDPLQVLDVRNAHGHMVVLDLENYDLEEWHVRASA